MIAVRGYKNCFVGVLGLGKAGLATCKALHMGEAKPICWDDSEEACDKAKEEGFLIRNLNDQEILSKLSSLIVAPGIPILYPEPHPIVKKAMENGVTIDNEIGLFFRSFATEKWNSFDTMPKVICVTGSNGKSTTTALLGHILGRNKFNVELGGNFGTAALSLKPGENADIKILEISSFQSEVARALQPDIAILLNISLDHIRRHGGKGGYFAAKSRLFTMGGPDKSIIGIDEDEGLYLANRMREEIVTADPVITFSVKNKINTNSWGVFVRKGFLSEWRGGRQISSIDLRELGSFRSQQNQQNLCAAYATARSLGLGPRKIENTLATFKGLKHRSQIIAKKRGVIFVNDSKATNVDSASGSLTFYRNIRWIAGGQLKDGGLEKLKENLKNVKFTYLIGSSVKDFTLIIDPNSYKVCKSLDVAVREAFKDAEPGDTILLSPACASYDQFENFEDRGDTFSDLVSKL